MMGERGEVIEEGLLIGEIVIGLRLRDGGSDDY